MDLTTIAVPHTLAHLTPLLPAPGARVLEAGCGRGALAAALADLGYDVTGVDRNTDAAAAAKERGVRVIEADLHDVTGEYDVVLFTRSLHHAENLDGMLAHAATLLAQDGRIVIEEFAWERVDRAAAHFLYDNRAMLVAAGLFDGELPDGDLRQAWVDGHSSLHQGAAILAALGRVGSELTTVFTGMLWRLVDGRGGAWTEPRTHVADALNAMRAAEQRRIAAGMLPSVGLYASARKRA
jgi:SAM-dependent methyltransferase